MFDVQKNPLDLSTIKFPNGTFYTGTDEIKTLLASAWMEADNKWFSKGEPIVFITPGIKSGAGKGNQGYYFPRAAKIKTKGGEVILNWYENKKVENGATVYEPGLESIGINDKRLALTSDDIERVLYMMLFNKQLITPKNPRGRTYVEDKEADAMTYEATEVNSAVISYWLYREESPFYSDEVRINVLCSAWGIPNPEKRSLSLKKKLLAEEVKSCDKRGDIQFNLAAFNKICEKIKDGRDTKDVDVLALIQKCLDKKNIVYNGNEFKVNLTDGDGNFLKTLCKVPPQFTNTWKDVLKKHLISSPDDFETLTDMAGIVKEGYHDVCVLAEAFPEPITEDWIRNTMKWTEKRKVYNFISGGANSTGKKQEEIDPLLIEYFVLQGRTINWKLKGS